MNEEVLAVVKVFERRSNITKMNARFESLRI